MDRYPPISDHGLIGDLQTAALVSTDGTVDWFCCPRFDSPSVFASLLDHDRGGHFRVGPDRDDYITRQLYLPDTAILITRFMTTDGVGEVLDFMPVTEGEATGNHRLVRILHVVRGTMRFVGEIQPRFDYGRQPHTLKVSADGAVFHTDALELTLHLSGGSDRSAEADISMEPEGDGIRVRTTMNAGQIGGVVLESSGGPPRRVPAEELMAQCDDTAWFWHGWLSQSTYTGRWRDAVRRSAMTLKLMTYAPTGALIAAPTAGLPERIGGERNWDYRYAWVRDCAFSVRALIGLGYADEAYHFTSWMRDIILEREEGGPGPIKVMYRVDGTCDLKEEQLDHLAGYRGSRPVRIGNNAVDQLQLDIYGELTDLLHLSSAHGWVASHEGWKRLAEIIDWLCANWDRPEDGIWETRGGSREFTFGRVMSWVAFDRAIRLARLRGRPADLGRWTAARDRVYDQILEHGWNPARGAFVQHYASDVLDASLLLMPALGFIGARDPMWVSTLDAIDEELVSDSLVYRYNTRASPDGLRGAEGTFSACTFWLVNALARSGRLPEARLTFEKMCTYGNHLQLYSEQVGLTGEQLGNFPQALTHLALINAALTLDRRLDQAASQAQPILSTGWRRPPPEQAFSP
jgi:GH15 family glucan-1,4-alpha-glucosidase